MKIFLTGATGFIGKQVLEKLTNTEHELFCLVRKNSSSLEKLRTSDVNVVLGDVQDKPSVKRGMRNCDWVIHLANCYSFWEKDKSVYYATNVEGTRNIMECVLETGVAKVVHVSSVVTYGKPAEIPFKEDSTPGSVRFSKYAQSKYEGDQIAWNLHENKGLPLVVVYPCGVLGAGDPKASGEYIKQLVKQRLPANVFKNSILTWVYVKDVAEAILRATEKSNNLGEKYFIGGYQISFRDFNKMISDISGVASPSVNIPDFLAMGSAYLLTGISNFFKKNPAWNMSVDQMKTMKEGFRVDGSKAERELGVTYTPINIALEEEIQTLGN